MSSSTALSAPNEETSAVLPASGPSLSRARSRARPSRPSQARRRSSRCASTLKLPGPRAASRWRRRSHWSAGPARRVGRPRRRHAARLAAIAFRRSAHSGPNARASSPQMRAARPGLLPLVDTVSSRSPRRTWAGLWKSQRSITSSTLTRQPAARAVRASGAASARGRSTIQTSATALRSGGSGSRRCKRPPARAASPGNGRSEKRLRRSAPASNSSSRRRSVALPRPTSAIATCFGSTMTGIMRGRARADHAAGLIGIHSLGARLWPGTA